MSSDSHGEKFERADQIEQRLGLPQSFLKNRRSSAAGPPFTKPAAEPLRAADWQQNSVRGFLAGVVRKRLKLKLRSKKVDGHRIYQIAVRSAATHSELASTPFFTLMSAGLSAASSTTSWSRNGTRASRPKAMVMLSTCFTASSTSMISVSSCRALSTDRQPAARRKTAFRYTPRRNRARCAKLRAPTEICWSLRPCRREKQRCQCGAEHVENTLQRAAAGQKAPP
jgi:hypothetical protein